jgi:small subunit ribosomal protein S9
MSAKEAKSEKYFEAIGRRKTASARVRITEAGKSSVTINEKDIKEYFPILSLQETVYEPLTQSTLPQKFKITVVAKGGGQSSQAGAVRHGITRALVLFDEGTRKNLKKLGFLKRDPRMKERRKFGLKKARKAPQWSKR